MGFDEVIRGLKEGRRYYRDGWNGKGMFLFLVPGSVFRVNREPLLSVLGPNAIVAYRAHIDIKTADGPVAVWTPSQEDMMADDWKEVEV